MINLIIETKDYTEEKHRWSILQIKINLALHLIKFKSIKSRQEKGILNLLQFSI